MTKKQQLIIHSNYIIHLHRLLEVVDERPLGGRDPDLGVGVFLVGDRRDDEADEERPRVGVADPKGVDFPELALELAFDRGGVPVNLMNNRKKLKMI